MQLLQSHGIIDVFSLILRITNLSDPDLACHNLTSSILQLSDIKKYSDE